MREPLKEFARARDQILAVIDEAEKHADTQAIRGSMARRFEAARQQISEDQLNLVVVGAEGVGKSTLLNGLAGADICPTASSEVGTLAPIYIEWGPSGHPQYFVEYADQPTTLHPVDAETFRSVLRARTNHGNKLGIRAGWVRVDNPFLRSGVRLVDMPGFGGRSQVIAAGVDDFLRQRHGAFIAVVKDRQVGPLVALLRAMPYVRQNLQFVVGNIGRTRRSLDERRDGLPEAWTEEWMSYQQDLLAEALAEASPDLAEVSVHVVHLLTFEQIGREDDPEFDAVDTPAHAVKAATFSQQVGDFLSRSGASVVLAAAAGAAERVLSELLQFLRGRMLMIDMAVDGDPEEHRLLRGRYGQARAVAESAWRETFTDQAVEAMALERWPRLRLAVDQARGSMLAAVRRAEEEVSGTAVLSQPALEKIGAALATSINGEITALSGAYGEVLGEALSIYLGRAAQLLDDFFAVMQVFRDNLGEIALDAPTFVNLAVKRLDAGEIAQSKRLVAAGVTGFLTYLLTSGDDDKSGALLQAVAAGGMAYVASSYFGLGSRDQAIAEIERVKKSILALGADMPETERDFRSRVARLADQVRQELDARFDEVKRIFTDLDGARDRLQAEKTSIQLAQDKLAGELQHRITHAVEWFAAG